MPSYQLVEDNHVNGTVTDLEDRLGAGDSLTWGELNTLLFDWLGLDEDKGVLKRMEAWLIEADLITVCTKTLERRTRTERMNYSIVGYKIRLRMPVEELRKIVLSWDVHRRLGAPTRLMRRH